MNDPRCAEEQRRRWNGFSQNTKASPKKVAVAEATQLKYKKPIFGLTKMAIQLYLQQDQYLHPYLMIGNKQREAIVGRDQYNMVHFLLAWP